MGETNHSHGVLLMIGDGIESDLHGNGSECREMQGTIHTETFSGKSPAVITLPFTVHLRIGFVHHQISYLVGTAGALLGQYPEPFVHGGYPEPGVHRPDRITGRIDQGMQL